VVLSSWLRDVKKLTILYLAAGLAFVPWGVAYAVLRLWGGWTHPAVTLAVLGCGTVTALFVWRRLEAKLIATPTLKQPANVPAEMRIDYARGSEADSLTTLPADVPFYARVFVLHLDPGHVEIVGGEIQFSSVETSEPVAQNVMPRRTQIRVLTEAA